MIPIPVFLMIILAILAFTILLIQLVFKMGYKKGTREKETEWVQKSETLKKESLNQQRRVIKGKVSEQLAPFLPDFPFRASECRFLGSPIDLVIFNGMDQGLVQSIYLVDIKTDGSRLSPIQNSIRAAVQNKQVFWYTYQTQIDGVQPQNSVFEEPWVENFQNLFSEPEKM
jgi:predicted Holliday junction resolvase-like endonuclease